MFYAEIYTVVLQRNRDSASLQGVIVGTTAQRSTRHSGSCDADKNGHASPMPAAASLASALNRHIFRVRERWRRW